MVKQITVLLATYNGEKYLPQLLSSLQTQTDPAFRVLFQDDGSSDDTCEILTPLSAQDTRFSSGTHPGRHLGAAGNFLDLLSQCETEYAAFCDQDDIWQPERLSACRSMMETLEAAYGSNTPLLVHSDCRIVSADGECLHESFFAHQGWDPKATSLQQLLVQNNVTGCTILINRALAKLICEHADPDTLFMHDWFAALTAAAFGHIAFVPHSLVSYRQHGSNVLGASRNSLPRRAVSALRHFRRGKERIALTYRNATAFRQAYRKLLPAQSDEIIARYLSTQKMSKLRRVLSVRRGGYQMQSRITRLGQILLG